MVTCPPYATHNQRGLQLTTNLPRSLAATHREYNKLGDPVIAYCSTSRHNLQQLGIAEDPITYCYFLPFSTLIVVVVLGDIQLPSANWNDKEIHSSYVVTWFCRSSEFLFRVIISEEDIGNEDKYN